MMDEQQWRLKREAGGWVLTGYGCTQTFNTFWEGLRFLRKYAPAIERQFKAGPPPKEARS
jgi:hypothetical protein